ncbi:MAG: hypothetical protein K2N33_04175, partial [Clostridia bacterium]|nr:hypothetical protein [Clostridia bacterium]
LESLLFAERAAKNIDQSYKAADGGKAKSAAARLNFEEYKDVDKLLNGYKNILLNAIKEAENVKPRKHEN